jgi:ABC-type lipoprotein release transport system permease subunit
MVLWGAYSLKNLWARRVTIGLTMVGMGLVVFVFMAVMMLAQGLERAMGKTGDPANAIVLRKGALSDLESAITREQAAIIAVQPEVLLTPEGRLLAVREVALQITLHKPGTGNLTSLSLRGSAPDVFAVRPRIRLVEGRSWEPGTTEIIVGSQVAKQFPEVGLHQALRFGNREWTVVGVFDGEDSGFDSEVWGDAEQFMATLHHTVFSSITMRLAHPDLLAQLKDRLERDPRYNVTVKREPEYYEGKAETLARMIRMTGLFLTVVFSIGAMLGATMTMSASVAQRTTEIGTLRTLGFTRLDILRVFLLESIALGATAGLAGIACASLLQFTTVSTMNYDTGTEIVFRFHLAPEQVGLGLLFAILMSVVGGLVPAARAARLDVVQALGERTA